MGDLLNQPRNDLQPLGAVIRQKRTGALTVLGHPPDHRHRSDIVVIPLDAPSGDCHVVHAATQSKVGFDIKLQFGEDWPLPTHLSHKRRVIHHIVEQGEPVPGRGF